LKSDSRGASTGRPLSDDEIRQIALGLRAIRASGPVSELAPELHQLVIELPPQDKDRLTAALGMMDLEDDEHGGGAEWS
jgi:hypothetical protein